MVAPIPTTASYDEPPSTKSVKAVHSTGWIVPFHLAAEVEAARIRRAYDEFAHRAGRIEKQRGAKMALVESAIDSFGGQFTSTDLERACPGVSRDMIRRLLRQMRKTNRVECLGRGLGAAWRKKT